MTKNNLPQWRQELKFARKIEGESPSNRWFQLATVNRKNQPRLRTVVLRGWQEPDSMLFFTDKRSGKIEQLKFNPTAEVLSFFFKSKTQFRFKGIIKELIDNELYWDTLTEKSKSSWFWEFPGKKRNNDRVPSNLNLTNLEKPWNFVVLQFKIHSVDILKLDQPIHKRYLWEKKNKWNRVEINP